MKLEINAHASCPRFVIVDEFLTAPDTIRKMALQLEYSPQGSKGLRSKFLPDTSHYVPVFERLLNRRISKWDYPLNGRFQFCTSHDQIVYHADEQNYGGILFLTPDAPPESGTTFYRSKANKLTKSPTQATAHNLGRDRRELHNEMFQNKLFDSTAWEPLDRFANRYNRLILWTARHVHAASCYFGHNINTGRLFQIFFFDCE